MQKVYGFGNKANLMLAALNGATYAISSWCAGKFSQRFGYFSGLKLGFLIMLVALSVGAFLGTAAGHIAVMACAVVGMAFTWPTLEALAADGESDEALSHMVGVYNLVWAAWAAFGYFIGGALLDRLGLKSLFYVPILILLAQLVLAIWLESRAGRGAAVGHPPGPHLLPEKDPIPPEQAKRFLRMAWIANPFAYIGINTLIAVVPGIAAKLELSTTLAGVVCSTWCFGRFGAFLGLWLWEDWHYRFRWLLVAFVVMIGSFAAILTIPNLVVLVTAQLAFGCAVGHLYYSSLYYSMHVGETKGEHGGFHEAAIGIGNFAGPTVGAASLHFLPQYANSGALAVSGLLLIGLGGMLAVWRNGRG
jgi:predicted MFS family arabinose efflux permease